jgi:hypothetical protein
MTFAILSCTVLALFWSLPRVVPRLRHGLWYCSMFGVQVAAMLAIVKAVDGRISLAWVVLAIAAAIANGLLAKTCVECELLVYGRGPFDAPIQCASCGGELEPFWKWLVHAGQPDRDSIHRRGTKQLPPKP